MGTKSWQSLFLLLFIVNEIACSTNWNITTRYNRLIISNASITNDADLDQLDFSTVDEVEFDSPTIETLTLRMQSPMANIKQLGVFDGNVPSVQVAPHFESIYIGRANTETVEIKPDDIYRTVDLAVTKSKLKALPKNLSAMRNLRELNLHSNLIETVEMAELNGLNFLKELILIHNRITQVNFNQAVLPKLRFLELSNNRIKDIRMDTFTAPSLVSLNLNDNHLESVDMSQFNNLNLEVIQLAFNKIKKITPNSISLPKLEVLTVEDNELTEVDFRQWNSPSMQVINVESNRLRKVPGLTTTAFPALEEVWLFPNRFECDWVKATVAELEARNVTIKRKHLTACDEQ